MNIPLFDLITAIFFLLSLIVTAKLKEQINKESKECFRYIFSGLVIITFMSLTNIYFQLGLFNSVPFISEPLFFKLIYWIGNITGITILISGASSWLPIARMFRLYNENRIKRLDIIKKVEQLIRVENRITVILSQTLKDMTQSFEFNCGAVYVYSQKKKSMNFISSHCRDSAPAFDMTKLNFKNDLSGTQYDGYKNEISDYFETESALLPDIIIPIRVNKILLGAYLFYKEESIEMSNDDVLNLKIIADIVAGKITSATSILKEKYELSLKSWQEKLYSSINYNKKTDDNIRTVLAKLKEKVSFDYFSLSMIHDDKTVQRFTATSENASLLNEINIEKFHDTSITHYVFNNNKPVYISDLGEETELLIDNFILKSNMRSLLAMPVEFGNKVSGVVLFASFEIDKYNNIQRTYFSKTLALFANLIQESKKRYNLKAIERKQSILDKFTKSILQSNEIQSMFNMAATVIARELKPALTRISTYDKQNSFLNSRALLINTPAGRVTPESGSMILSLMSYHRMIKDKSRTMLINQEETELKMSEAEQKQFFGDNLKSALLVPIMANDSVFGVISLGEQREWSRYHFNSDDIKFVQSISTLLSIAITVLMKQSKVTANKSIAENNMIEKESSRVAQNQRSRIRSSLTGILGSVEILKSKSNPTEDNIKRCLSIIDKSAQKINDYIQV